jgi:hypothetical protein
MGHVMPIVCWLALVAASMARPTELPRLLPVDEAARHPTFFSFRAQLQAAIARRDVKALMAVVDPAIRNGFGGDDGVEAFRKQWRIGAGDSAIWGELGAVLALGGTFSGEDAFTAPYTFSRWPEAHDSFEHVVLVGERVRLRAAPRQDAAVIATHSFAILKLARARQDPPEGWQAVMVDGRTGYVSTRFVRSPIGYRAFFTRQADGWKMVMFLAGD